jgi:hypothetical protein
MTALGLLHGVALSLVASGQASQTDAQEALRPVLAYEAALHRGELATCVPARTEGTAFDEARQEIRSMRDSRPRNAADAAWRVQYLSTQRHRLYDWRRPLRGGERSDGSLPPPINPAQAAELSAATWPLVVGEPGLAPAIELGPIPAPLHADSSTGCGATLKLSAAAIAGDLAFVETSYVCGGLCGNGWLYALRHEGGEWRIIAVAFTWIS